MNREGELERRGNIQKLANTIQQLLCETAMYDRNGEREIPLWDSFDSIASAIEAALALDPGTLDSYANWPGCDDEDCDDCTERRQVSV